MRTLYQAPSANAFAERWVRRVREECLDHLFILNASHLQRALREYVDYSNEARPHQGIRQETPIPMPPCAREVPSAVGRCWAG
jgi:putative transposase